MSILPERDAEFWLMYRDLDALRTMTEVECALTLLYVDTGDLDGYACLLDLQQLRRVFGQPTMVHA